MIFSSAAVEIVLMCFDKRTRHIYCYNYRTLKNNTYIYRYLTSFERKNCRYEKRKKRDGPIPVGAALCWAALIIYTYGLS